MQTENCNQSQKEVLQLNNSFRQVQQLYQSPSNLFPSMIQLSQPNLDHFISQLNIQQKIGSLQSTPLMLALNQIPSIPNNFIFQKDPIIPSLNLQTQNLSVISQNIQALTNDLQQSKFENVNESTLVLIQNQIQQLKLISDSAPQQNQYLVQQLQAILENLNQILKIKHSQINRNSPVQNLQNQQQIISSQDSKINQNYPIFVKFFVGGIYFQTQGMYDFVYSNQFFNCDLDNDLEKYFEKFGKLEEVVIIKEKASGKSKGYGFVTFIVYPFESEVAELKKQQLNEEYFNQSLRKCISVRNLILNLTSSKASHIIHNRQLDIKLRDDDKQTRNQSQNQDQNQRNKDNHNNQNRRRRSSSPRRNRDYRSHNEYQRNQKTYESDLSNYRHDGVSNNSSEKKGESKYLKVQKSKYYSQDRFDRESQKLNSDAYINLRDKIFIGGIDQNMNEKQLKNFFGQYGEVKDCQIIKDPVTSQNKGFAFIKYFDENVARDIITKMQVAHILGKRVDLRTADLKATEKNKFEQTKALTQDKYPKKQEQYKIEQQIISNQNLENLKKAIMIPPSIQIMVQENSKENSQDKNSISQQKISQDQKQSNNNIQYDQGSKINQVSI